PTRRAAPRAQPIHPPIVSRPAANAPPTVIREIVTGKLRCVQVRVRGPGSLANPGRVGGSPAPEGRAPPPPGGAPAARGTPQPGDAAIRRALQEDRAALSLPPADGIAYRLAGPYPIELEGRALDEYVAWEV